MKAFLTNIFQFYLQNKDIRKFKKNFFYYIFYRVLRNFLNRYIKVGIYNFFIFCSYKKNKMSHSILRKCDFEDLKELQLIDEISNDGPTLILDCGSNFGFYSIYTASLNKNNKAIAFEASPKTFQELKKNIEINNLKNIKPYNLALTNIDNENIIFYESPNDWESSLIESNFERKIQTIIKTATLNSIIEIKNLKNNHVIIKLDVEGYEMQILEGAKKIIQQFSPIIILEFSNFIENNEVYNYSYLESFLEKFDYLIYDTNYKPVSLKSVLDKIENLPKKMFGVGNKFLVKNNSLQHKIIDKII